MKNSKVDSKDAYVSFTGPVEKSGGHLVLFVPLTKGGRELSAITRGIGDIDGNQLKIVIPTWLAEDLAIRVGCRISVDNRHHTFNIVLAPSAKPAKHRTTKPTQR